MRELWQDFLLPLGKVQGLFENAIGIKTDAFGVDQERTETDAFGMDKVDSRRAPSAKRVDSRSVSDACSRMIDSVAPTVSRALV